MNENITSTSIDSSFCTHTVTTLPALPVRQKHCSSTAGSQRLLSAQTAQALCKSYANGGGCLASALALPCLINRGRSVYEASIPLSRISSVSMGPAEREREKRGNILV